MGMILRIASSRIVGQGDIVGRSGYFSLNLSANSVMRGRLDARRTLKSLVADLRMNNSLSLFVKEMRKRFGLTQVDLAAKAGVGLRFVRELEQGKQTLRIDKVNQVLALFGHEVGAVPL